MEKVVVNCEAFALPDEELVSQIREEAMALIETGTEEGLSAARNVLEQAKQIEARREELGPIEQTLELTDAETSQYEADQEEGARHAARARRAERNARLAASDWTQFEDAPLTRPQRVAWTTYRQKLRDLVFDGGEPDWPAPPS